jgi:acyl carrier protein
MSDTDIIAELTEILTNTLDLDVSPEEVTAEATFFHDGLGLDSIDVLELVVAIEERWDVKIDNRELGEKVFVSVGALVEYIQKNRPTS